MSEPEVTTIPESAQSKPAVVKRGSIFARHPLATVFGPMAALIAVTLFGPIELFLCVLGFVVVLEFPLLTTIIVYGNRSQRTFAIGVLMSMVAGWFALMFSMRWMGGAGGGDRTTQMVATLAWLGTIAIGMICDGVRQWLEWAAGPERGVEVVPNAEFLALPRIQFSLRSMLVLMTVVAVACSLLFSTSSIVSAVIILLVNVAWSGVLVSMLVYTRGYLQTFCVGALIPASILLLFSTGTGIDLCQSFSSDYRDYRGYTSRYDLGFRIAMGVWWLGIVLSGLLAVVMRRSLARRSRLAAAEVGNGELAADALGVTTDRRSQEATPPSDPWQQEETLTDFVMPPEKDLSGESRA